MMSLMAIGSHDGALKEGLPSVSGQLGLVAVMDTMTGVSWGRMRTQLPESLNIRAYRLISSVLGKTTGAWPDFREREKEAGGWDRD